MPTQKNSWKPRKQVKTILGMIRRGELSGVRGLYLRLVLEGVYAAVVRKDPRAKEWIFSNRDDWVIPFPLACMATGYEPEWIRRMTGELSANSDSFRKPKFGGGHYVAQ